MTNASQPTLTTAPATLPDVGRVTLHHSNGKFEHAAKGGTKLALSQRDVKVARLLVELLALRDGLAHRHISQQTTSLGWREIEAIELKLEDIRATLKP